MRSTFQKSGTFTIGQEASCSYAQNTVIIVGDWRAKLILLKY
ncbi:MAG: hypothetical protein Q9P01_22290 [Anaerolineae bacterium]|nr:hypothetical protein [Anaerolineae bacterium]